MTFYVESLGCAKNQVDSEFLISSLEAGGLSWVGRPEEAFFIIVNTCGFITSAKEQSIQTALALKERFPEKKVIMIGCLVQRYSSELEREMGEIDGFVRLDDPGALWRIIAASDGSTAGIQGGSKAGKPAAGPTRPRRSRFLSFPGSAYVKAAEGCSNRCSYCAIPLIRGELASRPVGEVLEEIEELLERGVVEINLIAQDLASYGRDRGGPGLVELLRSIVELKGHFWLRLLYLHPDHFPDGLLDLAASEPRILPYFDIPFQHASSRLLARMGRRGSADSYLKLVGSIRECLPDAVIRSTFLVGFPGESEEDLKVLLSFQRESALDWAGVFAYSREEGTPAYRLRGSVPGQVAAQRKRAVEENQRPISERRLDRQVGRSLDVLVEERIQGKSLYLGRAYLQAPEVDGLVLIKAEALEAGRIVTVRIDRRAGIDLEASLV